MTYTLSRTNLRQADLEALLDEHVPSWRAFARIDSLGAHDVTLALLARDDHLRGGGISTATLMTLADRAAYYLTLAVVSVPAAATANLDIHFLDVPARADIRATARILLAGSRLVVSLVEICAADELVAHATVSYAVPRA
jgi:acyl-coenzyme A thioesterase PaaI-like protein